MVALESDDSELDDFLDDILEQGRSMLRKGSSSRTSMVASSKVGWYFSFFKYIHSCFLPEIILILNIIDLFFAAFLLLWMLG